MLFMETQQSKPKMQDINAEAQKKMQKELEDYLTKKKSYKDYVTSMSELTAWLQKRAKQ